MVASPPIEGFDKPLEAARSMLRTRQVLNTCGASTHGVRCEGAYSKLPQVTPARGSTRLSGDFAASVRLTKVNQKTMLEAHSAVQSRRSGRTRGRVHITPKTAEINFLKI
eukprot:scaffold11063_cov22-Phaeocystis_antarctica.AAC.1